MAKSTFTLMILLHGLICSNLTTGAPTPKELKFQGCMDKLASRADIPKIILTEACKNMEEWQHRASMDKSDPSAVKISKEQMAFMNSLGHQPGRESDWPFIPPNAKPRKEYRMLTDEERNKFHNAVNVLKTFYIDDKNNIYDTFVDFHFPDQSPSAHFGPNFLGWHREFLHRFERALQLVDADVTLPYWDTRMDELLGDNAHQSIMWTDEFMGNKRGDVTTGPFKNWILGKPTLNRNVLFRAESEVRPVFGQEDYDYVVSIDNFRNLTLLVDPYFEIFHGRSHTWVGGVMSDISNSPSDPSFYLHHCFMDFVWRNQQSRVFQEIGRKHYFYPREDDEEAYGVGRVTDPTNPNNTLSDPINSYHFYDNPMWPFVEKKNYEGLSDVYWLYSYYDDPATCDETKPSCGSPYLFCVLEFSRCAPKLHIGGNCSDFKDYDSCYNSACIEGLCTAV